MLTRPNNPSWHNLYLDSYIPLRHKSIHDPCPYGYRIPSNGTYNEFRANAGWALYSYIGGSLWTITNTSWFGALSFYVGYFERVGEFAWYSASTIGGSLTSYKLVFYQNWTLHVNRSQNKSIAISVRCIEECELLPEAY